MDAFSWIVAQADQHPHDVLSIAVALLTAESHPLTARQMVAITISHILKARSPAHLSAIREGWRSAANLARTVKEAIRAAVLCHDIPIRNQAAQAIALVFPIEGEGWQELLSEISQLLSQTSAHAIGMLSIFKEILELPYFQSWPGLPCFTASEISGFSRLLSSATNSQLMIHCGS
jgi:hypothetical protein